MSDPAEKGPFTTAEPKDRGGGAKTVCPDLHYISAIQIVKPEDEGDEDNKLPPVGGGHRHINVWCKPIPKVERMPDDMREKGPFVTKEPANSGGGGKAEALSGHYISAIQLVVDSDWHHQRSIRFWCKPFPVVAKMPDDLSEKGPVNTGYDPAAGGFSAKVQIEEGYFLSAVQIIREPMPGGPGVIVCRSINLWSKPLQRPPL